MSKFKGLCADRGQRIITNICPDQRYPWVIYDVYDEKSGEMNEKFQAFLMEYIKKLLHAEFMLETIADSAIDDFAHTIYSDACRSIVGRVSAEKNLTIRLDSINSTIEGNIAGRDFFFYVFAGGDTSTSAKKIVSELCQVNIGSAQVSLVPIVNDGKITLDLGQEFQRLKSMSALTMCHQKVDQFIEVIYDSAFIFGAGKPVAYWSAVGVAIQPNLTGISDFMPGQSERDRKIQSRIVHDSQKLVISKPLSDMGVQLNYDIRNIKDREGELGGILRTVEYMKHSILSDLFQEGVS